MKMILARPKSKTDNEYPRAKDGERGLLKLSMVGMSMRSKKSNKKREMSSMCTVSTAGTTATSKALEESCSLVESEEVLSKEKELLVQCKPSNSVFLREETATLEDAILDAKQKQLPLLLFHRSEAARWRPLCTACKHVLNHPLLVEAAEDLFATKVLTIDEYRKLPSHDNGNDNAQTTSPLPLLRILNSSSNTTLKPHTWTVAAIASIMVQARTDASLPVPPYLQILAMETPLTTCTCTPSPHNTSNTNNNNNPPFSNAKPKHAFFGTRCNHSAEPIFADLPGVLQTEAGYIHHQKTLQVTYDSNTLSYGTLVKYAITNNAADTIYFHTNDQKAMAQIQIASNPTSSYVRLVKKSIEHEHNNNDQNTNNNNHHHHHQTFLRDIDRKHYLRSTILRSVPLTELQKIKANKFIQQQKFHEATRLLSPRQGLILRLVLCQGNKQKSTIVEKIYPIDGYIGTVWIVLNDFGFFD